MKIIRQGKKKIIYHSITCYVFVPGCMFSAWSTVCAGIKPIKEILPQHNAVPYKKEKNRFSPFPIQWLMELWVPPPRDGLQRKPSLFADPHFYFMRYPGWGWIPCPCSEQRGAFSFSPKLTSRSKQMFLLAHNEVNNAKLGCVNHPRKKEILVEDSNACNENSSQVKTCA